LKAAAFFIVNYLSDRPRGTVSRILSVILASPNLFFGRLFSKTFLVEL